MAKLKFSAFMGAAIGLSIGGKEYTTDDEGVVEVPDEHVATLVESHGFELVPTKAAAAPAQTAAQKKAADKAADDKAAADAAGKSE